MISRITENILLACHNLNIEYNSPNMMELKSDAQYLAEIYLQFKILLGNLESLKQKYPNLAKELEVDIFDINKTGHHLLTEAHKIIKKGNLCKY